MVTAIIRGASDESQKPVKSADRERRPAP